MLIEPTIGLRYETSPEQLRFVLAKLREMLLAHPRIDSETVRVRFSGFGGSSLDIELRVYALTRDWNSYHAIREDIFLRVIDLVAEAGTGFAFPSTTAYLARVNTFIRSRSFAACSNSSSLAAASISDSMDLMVFSRSSMDV